MSKYFKITTNKSPISYKCGEKIVFTVEARENCEEIPMERVRWTLQGDDGKKSHGSAVCPFKVETTLDRPGFVRLVCTAYDIDDLPIADFDVVESGAGAELEKITYHNEIPSDFDDFWHEVEEMVAKHDTVAVKKKPYAWKRPADCKDYLCYELEVSTPVGNNATGFVTMPDEDGKYPLLIGYCGYCIYSPQPAFKKGYITLNIGAHGTETDMGRFEYFDKYNEKLANYGFDEKENDDPKTSYWYGVMIRDLCAAKYAKSLPQWNGKVMVITGGSQGAFQATTVAAHESAATLLKIFIPWFCDLNAENEGYMAGWRPAPREGLKYYDTVAQGSRVKCPVDIYAAYLGDYCCPPTTVTALYNAVTAEKKINYIQSGTHGYRPPEKHCFPLLSNPDTDENGELKKGKYRHYKGGEYELLFVSRDSETNEETVVYRSLYDDGKIWTRPKSMWSEYVIANGKQQRRFTYIGE